MSQLSRRFLDTITASAIAVVFASTAGTAWAQGDSPDEAAAKMTVAGGFRVELVACEPLVRQPVAIEFDDRGRLWVIQYLQYPNPEGLKRVKVDRYSRTEYDRVPKPPPDGPRGADRITILEDTDGDGRADRAKDFINGLNLTSGLAFGHGGVFVLNVPYLLFYPDRDRDDRPDGDPEVLLEGFGMQDAHSVANSLTWGPDGWLYGCQGSTVTARIRGVEFQQGVWRYHPVSKEFELFCEGGGNSWGLDFDRDGNLLYSTNVGGSIMLHGVQGAYLWKSFGKHGSLHNPYAFGYFDHVPHEGVRGGHVTVGGIFYDGTSFPDEYQGVYIAADLLGHAVYYHRLRRRGSTFTAEFAGELLKANDNSFAPSDVTLGPDGAVYICDWHDQRTAHPDPDADWDRSNGRIFRIQAEGAAVEPPEWRFRPAAAGFAADRTGNADDRLRAKPPVRRPFDVQSLSSRELVEMLAHPNDWYASRARRVLIERRDPSVVERLRQLALESRDDSLALRALWTLAGAGRQSGGLSRQSGGLYVSRELSHSLDEDTAMTADQGNGPSGGLNEATALALLAHPDENVRSWTVRFLGDRRSVSPGCHRGLVKLALVDPSHRVRSQLACTAKRLDAAGAFPIVQRLLLRDEDADDPYISLLIWWAVEQHAVTAIDPIVDWFTSPLAWKSPFVRDVILERLVRRYAAEGTTESLTACARLLDSAPDLEKRKILLAALDEGLRIVGRSWDFGFGSGTLYERFAAQRTNNSAGKQQLESVPAALAKSVEAMWDDETRDITLIRLAIRMGGDRAYERAVVLAGDERTDTNTRLEAINVLGEMGRPDCVPHILDLIARNESASLQVAAMQALGRFSDDTIAATTLASYASMSENVRAEARRLLFGREKWALQFLGAVDEGTIDAKDVPVDDLRGIVLHGGARLDILVQKHWGGVRAGTPEEKLAEMRRLNNDLRAASGDPVNGHQLFVKLCANCHRLFVEGKQVGPELTHANRKDRDFLLASLVDPGSQIRKEYLSYVISTDDGRLVTGMIAEQTPASITLLDAKNQRTTISRDEIDTMKTSTVSLMPDNLLQPLKPQELRDLFAYLQGDGPPNQRTEKTSE